VGAEAPFDLHKSRRIADIKDGTSNTWMVVETDEAVPWTKPDELAYDPKKPVPRLGNFFGGGFNAAFMDGSVHYFRRAPAERTLRALITHAGGEVINLERE
jgi:prepilin-type processing-associated H-X9-DG protein